jgi:GrpB-like predicted nucleotidyltransferase (UPF0157 family)
VDTPALVVDYDPGWPTLFEELRSRVAPAVAALGGSVEHVGSTAVPGLPAKPIVDMDVVVRVVTDVAPAIKRLVAIGYTHEGDLGIAGREAFRAPPDGPYHHLYVVVEGSKPHRDHLDLRDYLRRHPDEADRYAARKREIAFLLEADRQAYVAAKSDLIEEFLRRARHGPRD